MYNVVYFYSYTNVLAFHLYALCSLKLVEQLLVDQSIKIFHAARCYFMQSAFYYSNCMCFYRAKRCCYQKERQAEDNTKSHALLLWRMGRLWSKQLTNSAICISQLFNNHFRLRNSSYWWKYNMIYRWKYLYKWLTNNIVFTADILPVNL